MTVPVSHEDWQRQVIELAHALGWEHLHVRRSIGRARGGRAWQTTTNVKGWPDLLLWKAGRGFVAVECKVGWDRPTAEQRAVLDSLARAGAACMVAYPDDLEALASLLGGRPARPASPVT